MDATEMRGKLRDWLDGKVTKPTPEIIRALLDELDRVEAKLAGVEKERDEARALVTEANNSLYGSQGYFHSLNGGPFDKYHLATGIENLKQSSRTANNALR